MFITLPIPTLSIGAIGTGYLWQLAVTGAGLEMDRSSASTAEIATLDDWYGSAMQVVNVIDSDPYRLVDETLAKLFKGYDIPEDVLNRFSAVLFDWIFATTEQT